MDKQQMANPYQARVTRTEVTRSIPAFIPEILDETKLAMDQTFTPSKGSSKHSNPAHTIVLLILFVESAKVPVFDTMTHLIARISNRVMFGTALCRNENFLRAIVHFSETTPMFAALLHWSPVVLRSFVGPSIQCLLLIYLRECTVQYISSFLRYLEENKVLSNSSFPS